MKKANLEVRFGMVDWFNSTLKLLLRKLAQQPGTEWDKCLPFVLWAYRWMIHKTTGCSTFQMMHGREMRMPLDELACFWRGKEKNKEVDTVECIQVIKAKMELVRKMDREKKEEEKNNQKFYYDRKTTERKFTFGNYVLVFQPRKTDKLMNEWQCPFIFTEQITKVTFRVNTGRKVKTFHINYMNLGLLQNRQCLWLSKRNIMTMIQPWIAV